MLVRLILLNPCCKLNKPHARNTCCILLYLQLKSLFKEQEEAGKVDSRSAAAQTGASALQDWTPTCKAMRVSSLSKLQLNKYENPEEQTMTTFKWVTLLEMCKERTCSVLNFLSACSGQEELAAAPRTDAGVRRGWGEQWRAHMWRAGASRGSSLQKQTGHCAFLSFLTCKCCYNVRYSC